MADVDAQPEQPQAQQPDQPQAQQPDQPQQAQDPVQQQGENEPANGSGGIYGYYENIIANPWVQSAFNTYGWAKQQNTYLESTLNSVEQKAYGVASAAGQKATQTYETYYVKPRDTVLDVYNTNVERTKWALETGKTAAIHTGTVGIGAAVLATQMGVQLSAGGAGLVLDTYSACKGAGDRTIDNVRQMQQAVEKKIWDTVEEAQRVAKIPINKAAETSHSILDIIRALVERTLNIEVSSSPDDTIRQRVTSIALAVVSALSNKAHEQVIDPVSAHTQQLLDNLSKSIIIMDVMRAKREWAMEKVDALSASVSDLKTRLETEAKQVGSAPEEVLMKFIRAKAVALKDQLETLKEKGHQVFGDGNRVEGAIDYLQTLDAQLENAQDIYQVSEAVLNEARTRLGALGQWTSDLFNRRD